MICGKNQDLRVEVCISTKADLLFQKGGSKVLVNCAIEAANQVIDNVFDLTKSKEALNCVAVFPTRVFPAVMHFYLTYIESKVKLLMEKHQSNGILSTADLEQLSIWERLCQFMFSGSPKKLPTLLLKEIGCLTSLSERSIPYFFPDLFNTATLNLDLSKTWSSNRDNVRLYHLSLLERQYGTSFYQLHRAMLELEYYIDALHKSSKDEDKFFRLATRVFCLNIYLPEFVQEITANLTSRNDNALEVQEIISLLEASILQKKYDIHLNSEHMRYLQAFNKGRQTVKGFTSNFFEIFTGVEKSSNYVAKKGMFFPRALSLLFECLKTTARFSLQDFIEEFAKTLETSKIPILPFHTMKRYRFGIVETILESQNVVPNENLRPQQFWKKILPTQQSQFSLNLIPNFEEIINDLCQKFEVIDRNIFNSFSPSTDSKDAEAFIKCGMLAYRWYSKKQNGMIEIEENVEGNPSWITKTVYSLLLYVAIKLRNESIIDIFKDRKKSKNLAHHKVII